MAACWGKRTCKATKKLRLAITALLVVPSPGSDVRCYASAGVEKAGPLQPDLDLLRFTQNLMKPGVIVIKLRRITRILDQGLAQVIIQIFSRLDFFLK